MRKAETTITLYIDPRSGQLPMDPNCIPTYGGGCPSRFCKPEGYDNHMGDGVEVNMNGLTYDRELLLVEAAFTRSVNFSRLYADVCKRMEYGKTTTT